MQKNSTPEKINEQEQENEFVCPSCNRPLITERSLGFGTEEKIRPCVCTQDKLRSIGRIGWGN